ncbi:HEAT repeat domain-containing protein [Pedosphaera parvula]|nr:HEAT repeat domain-containing protein [Pedosphaera parvula]
MRKSRQIAVFIAVTLVVITVWVCFSRSREPEFQGRSLSAWLKQLDDGDTDRGIEWSVWRPRQSSSQAQAAQAIREIGTNSLPFLIKRMTRHESPLKTKALDFLRKKQSWIKIPLSTNHYPRQAALAFDVLGPLAKPAVPALSSILTNSQFSKEATIALAAIGPEGWTVLYDKLADTNASANSWVKSCIIWGMAGHHVTQPGTTELIMIEVTNRNHSSGGIAGWALGELGTNQDQVIPVLIKGLQSPDLATRWGACNGLGKFGTNAIIAVPALLQSLQDSNISVKNHAREALKLIDPEAARKAGVE